MCGIITVLKEQQRTRLSANCIRVIHTHANNNGIKKFGCAQRLNNYGPSKQVPVLQVIVGLFKSQMAGGMGR
jgi:hypothetical protein